MVSGQPRKTTSLCNPPLLSFSKSIPVQCPLLCKLGIFSCILNIIKYLRIIRLLTPHSLSSYPYNTKIPVRQVLPRGRKVGPRAQIGPIKKRASKCGLKFLRDFFQRPENVSLLLSYAGVCPLKFLHIIKLKLSSKSWT